MIKLGIRRWEDYPSRPQIIVRVLAKGRKRHKTKSVLSGSSTQATNVRKCRESDSLLEPPEKDPALPIPEV